MTPRIAGIMRGPMEADDKEAQTMDEKEEEETMEEKQVAVRVYTLVGSPARIIGESSVPARVAREFGESRFPWDQCDYVTHWYAARYATVDELTASLEGRRALEAWRDLDDAGWNELYDADRLASQVRLARKRAADGCAVAADLLQRGAPAEEFDEYENSHLCEHDHPRLTVIR